MSGRKVLTRFGGPSSHHTAVSSFFPHGLVGGFGSLAGLAILALRGGLLTRAFGEVVLRRLASAPPAMS